MVELTRFPRDAKMYRAIKLDNEIQALLISDDCKICIPFRFLLTRYFIVCAEVNFIKHLFLLATNVSRACLSVSVGALEDPEEVKFIFLFRFGGSGVIGEEWD